MTILLKNELFYLFDWRAAAGVGGFTSVTTFWCVCQYSRGGSPVATPDPGDLEEESQGHTSGPGSPGYLLAFFQ